VVLRTGVPKVASISSACGSCFALAPTAATETLLEIGAFSGATALCAKLGPVQPSGHEIALNCAAFTFMVPLGISSAAAVRVGYQLGKGDPAKAHLAGWSAIVLGAGSWRQWPPFS
jgi:multidrug resistance protein, MATE family